MSPRAAKSMQANTERDKRTALTLRRATHSLGLRHHVNRQPYRGPRHSTSTAGGFLRRPRGTDAATAPPMAKGERGSGKGWPERRCDINTIMDEHDWVVLRIWKHEPTDEATVRIAETGTELRRSCSHRVTWSRPVFGGVSVSVNPRPTRVPVGQKVSTRSG